MLACRFLQSHPVAFDIRHKCSTAWRSNHGHCLCTRFLVCCLYISNYAMYKSSAMSGNVHSLQVGGFLQRIDYVRKYAFGVMCILKNSEGQFPIRGFWIFRGQDIPQMMKDECYDLELYNWEKLDGKALNAVSTATLATPHQKQGCLADQQLCQP